MLSNQFIFENGELLEHWPWEIKEGVPVEECIFGYEGEQYSVYTDPAMTHSYMSDLPALNLKDLQVQ